MSTPGAGPAAEGGGGRSHHLADEESGIPRAARALLGLAAVLVLYYAAPVEGLPSGRDLAVSVLTMLGGVVLLSWLIARQFRRLLGARPGEEAVRLDSLVFMLYLVAPLFALGYVAVNDADPDQFVGLATKTDALYFTLSTLGTVGFGDIHAEGQLARGLVMVQMAFDLVFVAALASLLGGQIREQATRRRAAAGPGADDQPRQSPDPGAGAPERPPGEGGTGR